MPLLAQMVLYANVIKGGGHEDACALALNGGLHQAGEDLEGDMSIQASGLSRRTYLSREEFESLVRFALRARAVEVHEVGVDALRQSSSVTVN